MKFERSNNEKCEIESYNYPQNLIELTKMCKRQSHSLRFFQKSCSEYSQQLQPDQNDSWQRVSDRRCFGILVSCLFSLYFYYFLVCYRSIKPF